MGSFDDSEDTAYEAPRVTEESLDSGGNYVGASSAERDAGTLGSTIDPP
jgi:hypothetical protein